MNKNNLSRRDFIRKTSTISAAGIIFPVNPSIKNKKTSDHVSLVPIPEINAGSIDAKEFFNPGTEYRGVALWFFNDQIEKAEALRQLKGLRYAGWGRVIPRRYTGLLNPAYGKTWNEATKAVIEACKELDMKVFLAEIDKNGWYTAAPTPIPGMKDKYRNKSLIQRAKTDKPGKNETLIKETGKYSYYQYLSFPKEGWENSFCYLDLLDPDVVNSYSKVLFEFLDSEFGDEFGKVVEGIWFAEPHIIMGQPREVNCLPWTTKLPEIFEEQWGYPLMENLDLLFNDTGNYHKVRYHYYRTLSHLFTHSYTKITKDWCEKYNLKLTGHLMGEDSFRGQLQYTVNCMPHYEYMHIPGIDHLSMNLRWPTGDPFILTPKQASSIANQLGKKEVLSEMYGRTDQGLTFEDRKRMYQWFGIMGINYRCYHGPFSSIRGIRKRTLPPNLNYQQPYWNKNRMIADFSARLSYILRHGTFQADILVIHSLESYYFRGKFASSLSKRIDELDQHLIDLSHNLFKIQQSFDYGDETIIAGHGKTVNKRIQIGQMKYKTVIIPSVYTLRKSTVKILNDFADSGGVILSTGNLPNMIDGEINKDIEILNKKLIPIVNDPTELNKKLNSICPQNIQITSTNGKSSESIWIHVRNISNGQMYFLANISDEETIQTEIKIKGKGRIESWDLENGTIETIPQEKENGFIKTKLKFYPYSSYSIYHNEKSLPVTIKGKQSVILWQKTIDEFQVEREDPNALTLDFCKYRKLTGSWSELLPILDIHRKLNQEKYYGPVSLQFEFTAERKPSRCELVIEKADKYTISVNGTLVKYEGLPYYRDKCLLPVSITHLVQRGVNNVIITTEFQSAEDKVLGIENLERFYGTELEQVYLIGDFAVKGQFMGKDTFETVIHKYSPHFEITSENKKTRGDLLADGYCFFNGTIKLIAYLVIPEINESERLFLNIEGFEGVFSETEINNRKVGNIAWKPYRIDITDYAWKGENRVVISLTNSLRNLLGDHHSIPREKRQAGQTSRSNDYFFRPFGISGKTIISCEKFM